MRPSRTAVALLFASVAWIAVSAQSSAPGQKPASGTGIIAGRAVDVDTNRPIEEAIVTLTGPNVSRRVMVDEQGRFVFANLPAGKYSLDADQFGYLTGSYGRWVPEGSRGSIEISDGQRTLDATIVMYRYAAITGRVVDHAGDPVARVTVTALRPRIVNGRTTLDPNATFSTSTDDRGVYRISRLAPGNYAVAVPARLSTFPVDVLRTALTSGQSLGVAETARLGDSRYLQIGNDVIATMSMAPMPPAPRPDGRLTVFQTTYYPAAVSSPDAVVLPIKSGDERTGVDIQLAAVSTASVSGQILGPDGPVGLTPFRLVRAGGEAVYESSGFETATGLTTSDGHFTLLGVPSGRYEIRVGPSFISPVGSQPGEKPVYAGKEPITVGETDVTKVVVTAHHLAMLRGRLESKDGTRIQTSSVQLIIQQFDPGRMSAINPRVDDALKFSTQIVPGRYVFLAYVGSVVCSSVVVNGKEVGDALFPVGVENLDVVFGCSTATTRLTGHVRDSDGNPDPRAIVALFPTDRRYWAADDYRWLRIVATKSDATGSFTTAGLPAGEYFVVALPDTIIDAWRDPAELDTLSRSAARVSLSTGQLRAVDLVTVRMK